MGSHSSYISNQQLRIQQPSLKMKTALILLLAAACTMAYEVQPSKVTYSEQAQEKIRIAKENMIAELCFDQQPEPEIFETICLTAAVGALGQPITYNANLWHAPTLIRSA